MAVITNTSAVVQLNLYQTSLIFGSMFVSTFRGESCRIPVYRRNSPHVCVIRLQTEALDTPEGSARCLYPRCSAGPGVGT